MEEQGARFEVHIEKGRSLSGQELRKFSAQLDLGEGGATWNSSFASKKDAELEQVKELSDLGRSVRDIAKETGFSKSKVQRLKEGAATA